MPRRFAGRREVEKHIVKQRYTNTYRYTVVLRRLGAILAHPKTSRRRAVVLLGSLLELSWSYLGAVLVACWSLLGQSWGSLGGVSGLLGAMLVAIEEKQSGAEECPPLGAPHIASWSPLGTLVERSWGRLGALLGRLGASWGHLKIILARLGAILGPS